MRSCRSRAPRVRPGRAGRGDPEDVDPGEDRQVGLRYVAEVVVDVRVVQGVDLDGDLRVIRGELEVDPGGLHPLGGSSEAGELVVAGEAETGRMDGHAETPASSRARTSSVLTFRARLTSGRNPHTARTWPPICQWIAAHLPECQTGRVHNQDRYRP